MMSQKNSRLAVDLNDLREYDSSFTDPATSGQDNIADRYPFIYNRGRRPVHRIRVYRY